MIQIKERKRKYRNADKKMKATLRGRGFQLNSRTYLKSMNLTVRIIHRREENRTVFIERLKNLVVKSGRRRI
jgi:hypothetical protein